MTSTDESEMPMWRQHERSGMCSALALLYGRRKSMIKMSQDTSNALTPKHRSELKDEAKTVLEDIEAIQEHLVRHYGGRYEQKGVTDD